MELYNADSQCRQPGTSANYSLVALANANEMNCNGLSWVVQAKN